MACRKEIKDQVLEAILDVMLAAHRDGRDEYEAASSAFPDVPDTVILDANSRFLIRIEDEFWTSIERTIDGEIIRNALAARGDTINTELPI